MNEKQRSSKKKTQSQQNNTNIINSNITINNNVNNFVVFHNQHQKKIESKEKLVPLYKINTEIIQF